MDGEIDSRAFAYLMARGMGADLRVGKLFFGISLRHWKFKEASHPGHCRGNFLYSLGHFLRGKVWDSRVLRLLGRRFPSRRDFQSD